MVVMLVTFVSKIFPLSLTLVSHKNQNDRASYLLKVEELIQPLIKICLSHLPRPARENNSALELLDGPIVSVLLRAKTKEPG